MVSQTSKRGFETTYAYNFAGRNVRADRPDGSSVEIAPEQTFGLADPASGVGTEANPAPFVRAEDVIATFTDANDNVTTLKTNEFGTAVDTTDALSRQTVSTTDVNGQKTQVIAPNGAVTDMTYDVLGNRLSRTDAVGTAEERTTSVTYEPAFNLVASATDPAGKVTTVVRDASGNPTRITNPLGGTRTFTYDASGLVLTRTDENGATTTFTRDANGNVASITDAEGNVTDLIRDTAGNVLTMTEGVGTPEARTTSFAYDAKRKVSFYFFLGSSTTRAG